METQSKLRQDYVKTQDPRDKDELLRIADAYDAGYNAGYSAGFESCIKIQEATTAHLLREIYPVIQHEPLLASLKKEDENT